MYYWSSNQTEYILYKYILQSWMGIHISRHNLVNAHNLVKNCENNPQKNKPQTWQMVRLSLKNSHIIGLQVEYHLTIMLTNCFFPCKIKSLTLITFLGYHSPLVGVRVSWVLGVVEDKGRGSNSVKTHLRDKTCSVSSQLF